MTEDLRPGFAHRHLLGIDGMTRADITAHLDLADRMLAISERPLKRLPTLRGRTVINFFMEPSTRTRTSFELAGKRLSADVVNFTDTGSSTKKGETLLDTARNLDAMHPDVIVVRHAASGAPHFLARHVRAAIVNAGDGMHEHPTQALLDCATIRRHKHRIEGLTVTIVGDVAHSRVARSDIFALCTLGAQVRVAGPRALLPAAVETMGVEAFDRVEPALAGADVVIVLRLQQERMTSALITNTRDYARHFGVGPRNIGLARPDVIVMHPGPINRGVEIDPELADSPASVILHQVSYGVAVRMACLYLAAGRPDDEPPG